MKTLTERPLLQSQPRLSLTASATATPCRYDAIPSPDGFVSLLDVSMTRHQRPLDIPWTQRRRMADPDNTRDIFSVAHSNKNEDGDCMVVCTSIAGGVRISLRCHDNDENVEINLSRMEALSTIVASSCFIVNNNKNVLLRLVDTYGSILSFLLSEQLQPLEGYYRPLHAPMPPHPGSTVEHCQVCFPSKLSVILAMDPHLICIDFTYNDLLGSTHHRNEENDDDDEEEGTINHVQMWSAHHKVTYDPFQPPQTLGSLLNESLITMGMKSRDRNDEEEILSSVSALTCLHDGGNPTNQTTNQEEEEGNELTVITLHSDGSVRLWTSSTTTPIPLVRRIVLRSNEGYMDPPLSPSQWDAYDSIVLKGQIINDGCYELGLYVKCSRDGPQVHILEGSIKGLQDDMMTLSLPPNAGNIRDLAWNTDGLLVLMTTQSNTGKKEEEKGDVLALFPRGEVQSILPKNTASNGVNCFDQTIVKLTVEEELERYFQPTVLNDDEVMKDQDDDDSNNNDEASLTLDEKVAKVEASVDKAGLLSLLQPLGRPRPSALAVHRALLGFNLADDQMRAETVYPADIVGAMRKWKKRDMFRPSTDETALVVRENENHELVVKSPEAMTDNGLIYHMFASAKKDTAGRPSNADTDINDAVVNLAVKSFGVSDVESAENNHLMRWISFLSEVRRQEAKLNEALCFVSLSPSYDLLVRSNSISAVTIENVVKDEGPLDDIEGLMAKLDEFALDMLQLAASSTELRRMMCHVQSLLFDSASKASCLISGKRINGSTANVLVSEIEQLGHSILDHMKPNDQQLELHRVLSELDHDFIRDWIRPLPSKSASVRSSLGMNLNSKMSMNHFRYGAEDAQFSASTIATAQIKSITQLTFARSTLLLSCAQTTSTSIHESGLRASLFCAALLWSVNQPSHQDSSLTVLEHHFRTEWNATSTDSLSSLVDNFIRTISHFYTGVSDTTISHSTPLSSTREPRVTLRLVAPLVQYSFQDASDSSNAIHVAAKCLLVEASFVAKHNREKSEDLWVLASDLLMGIAATDFVDDSNVNDIFEALMSRVDTLVNGLQFIEQDNAILSNCCKVTLSSVHDAISFITTKLDMSIEMPELTNLWMTAFEISMKGMLWDDALASCVSSPMSSSRENNFEKLVLQMIDSNALGKLADMSMTVVGSGSIGNELESEAKMVEPPFDIFDASVKVIETAAYQQVSVAPTSSAENESVLNSISTYWDALYTLHASRGNWKEAARAMDMCGKAITSTFIPLSVNKAISKLIMDGVSLSATACAHAISMIDNPADRYLFAGNDGMGLLTEDDIKSRAIRASAVRAFSMDEYAPDSVASILKATSRDTIDMLARLGYYDHAISIAKGLAEKRKSCPGGMDLFEDSLKHILSTYLIPAAIKTSLEADACDSDEDIQSRSKIAQIRLSSSACSIANRSNQSAVYPAAANTKCYITNKCCDDAARSNVAMNLLRQYSCVYARSCNGLCLHVARSIMYLSDGNCDLPQWLEELCVFGVSRAKETKNGLFATDKDQVADPAGLVRLFIEYHRYDKASEIVILVLSKRNNQLSDASNRLPEKGSIDFVPYDLIDGLYQTMSNILASVISSDPLVQHKLDALQLMQKRMEKSLLNHFELLKLSEEGLKSARALALR